ncbi:hypothetical protein EJB05_35459, partial [Eragrostis curvula]
MSSSVPTPEWLPEGMDPKSSFLLEIKLLANPRKRRKECSCFSFTKVVDCDTTNFKDFIESIVDEFPPGYKEVVTIQYYDEGSKSFPPVETDQHLMAIGPPKRRKVTNKASTESSNSIVPFQDEGTALSMTYPPSQISEPATKKKGKSAKSDSSRTIKPKSGSGSNQLEVICDQAQEVVAATNKATGKVARKRKPKEKAKKVALDSPAMRTRSKIKLGEAICPALGTRSKRRLSL